MAFPVLTDTLIIGQARKLLGEPTAHRFSDAELTRYANQGLTEMMSRSLGYQATATFQVVTGQHEYTVAEAGLVNCIGVRAVHYAGGSSTTVPGTGAKALLKMSTRHFSKIQISTAAYPKEYLWAHSFFYVWPKPIAGANTHVIAIQYYKGMTTITSDSFQLMPLKYGPYLVWFTYASALQTMDKEQQAQQYFSYFYNFVDYHGQEIQADFNNVDTVDGMGLADYTQFA